MTNLPPILLAEDDNDDAFFMEQAFTRNQVRNPLVRVPNGQKAVWYLNGEALYADRAKYPKPCLVLLDLKMPFMDGFGVLAWIQRQPSRPDWPPAIVLSASPSEADKARAFELGAREFLVKPSQFDRLVSLVQDLKSRWLERPVSEPTGP